MYQPGFEPATSRLLSEYAIHYTTAAVQLGLRPGPEAIQLFSSSAQLSMKFQLLINAEIAEISEKFRLKPQNLVIYPTDEC